ncbi:unnamed protein product [Blepharisma stoltei]|uniref:Uncharacterized protein n=1 Tax=Blepharisma stoltei TaxID=1481888 RepID=A0AAU9K251_9CILI|nr:unnamed protein product [Blepharisma stoltei]
MNSKFALFKQKEAKKSRKKRLHGLLGLWKPKDDAKIICSIMSNTKDNESDLNFDDSPEWMTDVKFKDYEAPKDKINPFALEKNHRIQEATKITHGKYVELINQYGNGNITLNQLKSIYESREKQKNGIGFRDIKALLSHTKKNCSNFKTKFYRKHFEIYQDFNPARSITPSKEVEPSLNTFLTARPLGVQGINQKSPPRSIYSAAKYTDSGHKRWSSVGRCDELKSNNEKNDNFANKESKTILELKHESRLSEKNMQNLVHERLFLAKKSQNSRPNTPSRDMGISIKDNSKSRKGSSLKSRPATASILQCRRTVSSFGSYDNWNNN